MVNSLHKSNATPKFHRRHLIELEVVCIRVGIHRLANNLYKPHVQNYHRQFANLNHHREFQNPVQSFSTPRIGNQDIINRAGLKTTGFGRVVVVSTLCVENPIPFPHTIRTVCWINPNPANRRISCDIT